MNDKDLIRDALDIAAGGASDAPVWGGVRERAGALQRRRRMLRAGGGGTLVAGAGAVAIALLATGVFGNDEHRVIASPPVAKPDTEIVAVKGPNTDDALVVMSADNGHVVRTLTHDVGFTLAGIAATPDGQTIYFTRHFGALPCELGEIAKVDRNGGPVRRVTTGINPVISPDGRTLAYATTATGADPCSLRGAIVLRDLASGSEQEFGIGAATSAQPLAWSPDGTHLIVASSNVDVGRWRNLTSVDVSSGVQTLLALPGPADDATYLPDGRLVVAFIVPSTGTSRRTRPASFCSTRAARPSRCGYRVARSRARWPMTSATQRGCLRSSRVFRQ